MRSLRLVPILGTIILISLAVSLSSGTHPEVLISLFWLLALRMYPEVLRPLYLGNIPEMPGREYEMPGFEPDLGTLQDKHPTYSTIAPAPKTSLSDLSIWDILFWEAMVL